MTDEGEKPPQPGKWHPSVTVSTACVMHRQDHETTGRTNRTAMIMMVKTVTSEVFRARTTELDSSAALAGGQHVADIDPRPAAIDVTPNGHRLTKPGVALAKSKQISAYSPERRQAAAIGKHMGSNTQAPTGIWRPDCHTLRTELVEGRAAGAGKRIPGPAPGGDRGQKMAADQASDETPSRLPSQHPSPDFCFPRRIFWRPEDVEIRNEDNAGSVARVIASAPDKAVRPARPGAAPSAAPPIGQGNRG